MGRLQPPAPSRRRRRANLPRPKAWFQPRHVHSAASLPFAMPSQPGRYARSRCDCQRATRQWTPQPRCRPAPGSSAASYRPAKGRAVRCARATPEATLGASRVRESPAYLVECPMRRCEVAPAQIDRKNLARSPRAERRVGAVASNRGSRCRFARVVRELVLHTRGEVASLRGEPSPTRGCDRRSTPATGIRAPWPRRWFDRRECRRSRRPARRSARSTRPPGPGRRWLSRTPPMDCVSRQKCPDRCSVAVRSDTRRGLDQIARPTRKRESSARMQRELASGARRLPEAAPR